MKSPVQELQIDALRDAGNARRSDVIAVEEPLEIRLMREGLPEADENDGTGRSISITMRTPGHDAELAVGFLYGEGLLRDPRDVIDTGFCGPTGNILRVTVRADLPLDLARLTRNFYTTSSCGVCGKASIEAVTANAGERRIASEMIVRESVLRGLPETLKKSQTGFAETGGMHAVGLFTPDGRLIASREGRASNAMDKLVGAALLARNSMARPRGAAVRRASFELLQRP
jgi:FdhD protein